MLPSRGFFKMLKRIFLVLLFSVALKAACPPNCADGTQLKLDVSKRTVTITNTGSLGGSQTITCDSLTGEICKIRFYMGGDYTYIAPGGDVACPDPCTYSINTEYGRVSYLMVIRNSADNTTLRSSGRSYLRFTQAPVNTGPWPVPIGVHGFKDYKTAPMQFNIPAGTDVSGGLRIWLRLFNVRPGVGSVITNNGTEHIFNTTHITDLAAVSGSPSTCTATTATAHGLSTNDIVQINGVSVDNLGAPSTREAQQLNSIRTVASTPTTKTFTFACGTMATEAGLANILRGQDMGVTVSKEFFHSDEKKYNKGLEGLHQNFRAMVQIATSEFTVNANNVITFVFKDIIDSSIYGTNHGYYLLGFNVVNGPDLTVDQVVVTGGNTCTAHTTSTIPAAWVSGDTLIFQDAPGPQWQFNDLRTITLVDGTHFTFSCGPDVVNLAEPGETLGVAPYTITNGTYVVPTSNDVLAAPQPVMRVAHALIPKSSFAGALDPSTVTLGGDPVNGKTVFTTALLKEPNNAIPNNQSIATCQSAGCHTNSVLTVSDLKYFGFTERVETIAGMRRGLSESDAKDVAAFLTSNAVTRPVKGWPWNAPFQPGPGLDSTPISNWSAGNGLEWELSYDNDMCKYTNPGAFPPTCTGGSYSTWDQNANPGFNVHEIPIHFGLPHWMQWLPRTSPSDWFHYFLNDDFTTNLASTNYQKWLTDFTLVTLTSGINSVVTSIPVSDASKIANNHFIQFASGEYAKVTAGGGVAGPTSLTVTRATAPCTPCTTPIAASQASGTFVTDFTQYINDGELVNSAAIISNGGNDIKAKYGPEFFATGGKNFGGYSWPNTYANAYFDIYTWNISRKWELTQSFWLQNCLDQTYRVFNNQAPNALAAPQYTRGIFDQMTFDVGPHKSWGNANNRSYFFNTTQEDTSNWGIYTAQWYHLSAILDAGDRFSCCNLQQDFPYYQSFNDGLGARRASRYVHFLGSMFQFQNALGYTTINGPPGGYAQVQQMRLDFPFSMTRGLNFGADSFLPEATKAEIFAYLAGQTLTMLQTASISDWQTYIVCRQSGTCTPGTTLTAAPNRTNGLNGIGNYSDSFAYALAVMNYYNVNFTLGIASTINSIVAILDNIYSIPAHTYATDAAATCTMGSTPLRLACP